GTMCRAPRCADGVATSEAWCSGMEAACPESARTDCAPYVCAATACRTDCRTSSDCVMGFRCVDGQCEEDGDGGIPADAGGRPGTTVSGCGCRAPGLAPDTGLGLASTLGGVVLLGRKRRRR
ncbi:MAG: hypothetical protein NZ898_14755, partial [Myxococcota bacterium]|nr:hypothetical protein [Myxococcota bacterium]